MVLYSKPDLECGAPASIDQGSYELLNGTLHYLSTVQYTCDEGHVLVGRGSLNCDVDEKWNGPPPRCDREFFFNNFVKISNVNEDCHKKK